MRRPLTDIGSLAFVLLVTLGSCAVPPDGPSADGEYAAYVFDSETHLCFTRSRTASLFFVYSYVPCTDRVLAKIFPEGVPAEARVAQAMCRRD